jgi:hypothetical protein
VTAPPPGLQPPSEPRQPRRPGVVSAAAVVTLVGATGTAGLTLLLTVGLLWVAGPVLDAFDSGSGDPRWLVLSAAAVLLLLPDSRRWFRASRTPDRVPAQ